MRCKSGKKIVTELLETRTLMSASTSDFVYIESNNPNQGQNAVLAYSENPATGALTALPHGRYLTGGTGNSNAAEQLGPDDSDKEVIATPDGHFLFAVNQGSNTVAEFAIQDDGSLQLLSSAPFKSGGDEPVSLSFSNDRLYVLNRGNSAQGTVGTVAPDLTGFFIGEDGQAIPIQNSTVKLPLNLSPAQVLTSGDGKFTFVDDFATPSNLSVSLANTIEPFIVNGDGTLSAVKNGAAGLPSNPPLVLGLVEDPVRHLIYTGIAPSGGVATFSYNDYTGAVKFVGTVPSKGAGTCWLNISPNGKYLYATDSGSDTLSVYSLANPYKPSLIQEFALTGPTIAPGSSSKTPTTADFQFSFDPTGNYLYVVNHAVTSGFQQGDQLHTLDVAANGKLSEPQGPLFFPTSYVPAGAHVQGIAVVAEPNAAILVQNALAQLFSSIEISNPGSAAADASLQAVIDALLQEIGSSAA